MRKKIEKENRKKRIIRKKGKLEKIRL